MIYNLIRPKKVIISSEAYKDMYEISSKTENPNETLIITRHGLVWCIASQLKVKMTRPQIEIDRSTIAKYDQILILHQKNVKLTWIFAMVVVHSIYLHSQSLIQFYIHQIIIMCINGHNN